MSTVSEINLTVNLSDSEFVDSIKSRQMYSHSAHEIALQVMTGTATAAAGLTTSITIYNSIGSVTIDGTATDANGLATIAIANNDIEFNGDHTCVVKVNGSISASFPLSILSVSSGSIPIGATLDWNDYTYVDTATKGPVRAGTGIASTVNADGSNTHSVSYGSTAGTALEGNAKAADVDPAGTDIAAALAGKVSTTAAQTIDGIKTFLQRLVSNELRARTDDGLDIAKSDGNSLIRVGTDGATKTGVAEGVFTTASGDASHAEGTNTTASGEASHAGGASSLASQILSYARGRKARSVHTGASVESDNQDANFDSTAENQKSFRFAGGYRFMGGAAEFEGGIDGLVIGTDVLAPNGNGSALTSLTAANITGQVAIAQGGTGAATAQGARDGLGAAAKTPTVNAQTGTTYTLVLTDAGKIITATNGSAQTYTIPANASVAFPVGTIINVIQAGSGVVTLEGDTGVTVNGTSAGSVDTTTQYQGAALLKTGADEWIISGAVE